jgi:hypothetical protein
MNPSMPTLAITSRHWAVRFGVVVLGLLLWALVLFQYRTVVLRALSSALVSADPPAKAKHLFVLSGAATERGTHAAWMQQHGHADTVICTGEVLHPVIIDLDMDLLEADLTWMVMQRAAADTHRIQRVYVGTSTWEEMQYILAWAQRTQADTVHILSTELHTRRIRWIANRLLRPADVPFKIYGAPALLYDRQRWWQTEDGLISVNNEWIKNIYYNIRY